MNEESLIFPNIFYTAHTISIVLPHFRPIPGLGKRKRSRKKMMLVLMVLLLNQKVPTKWHQPRDNHILTATYVRVIFPFRKVKKYEWAVHRVSRSRSREHSEEVVCICHRLDIRVGLQLHFHQKGLVWLDRNRTDHMTLLIIVKRNETIQREKEREMIWQEKLTTAENVTISGFKSGASNRMKAPLLPICRICNASLLNHSGSRRPK